MGRVQIRNLTAGGGLVAEADVVEGGFDPVPVAADAGDQLELTFTGPDGQFTVVTATVPPTRPPVIVRTSPPNGRTDVALGIRPAVIFSEPIDPRTMEGSIRLSTGGTAVVGSVDISVDSPWAAQLVPEVPLRPGTAYELVITPDVRDLDGNPLEAAAVVTFTTVPGNNGPFVPWPAGALSFVDGHGVSIVTEHASMPTRSLFVIDGFVLHSPAWSPDGTRVAFSMVPSGSDEPWAIYVRHRDGTLVRLSRPGIYEMSPSWSPDGSRIVFLSRGSDGDDVFVMNADGTNRRRLTSAGPLAEPGFPAWSPDGQWIAYSWVDVSNASHVTGIYGIKPDGTETVRLTPSSVRTLQLQRPTWSPDGMRLAFLTESHEAIALIDRDGTDLEYIPVTTIPENLAWSPVGEYIAFNEACPPVGYCSTNTIWVARVYNGSLTLFPAWGYTPAWIW